MANATVLRIMTYNVHRCVGADGAMSPQRIARVIADCRPDVVALQELDQGRARSGFADQPNLIAGHLEMRYHFHPAIQARDGHYGDAVLSRHPMELARAGPLPARPDRPALERRGALWVTVHCGGRAVQVLNTHLGLD